MSEQAALDAYPDLARGYHRAEAMDALWSATPALRLTAHRQGGKLRSALDEVRSRCPVEGCGCRGGDTPERVAWRIGHHGGRLLALRLEAYDRKDYPR